MVIFTHTRNNNTAQKKLNLFNFVDSHAVMEMKKIADERRREKLEEKRLK